MLPVPWKKLLMSQPATTADLRNAVFCLHCGERSFRPAKTTFLGFRKLKCGQCGRESIYPLSKGYFNLYRASLALSVILCIIMLSQRSIPIPGLLFFAAIYGLWRDRQLCQSVAVNPPSERMSDPLTSFLEGVGPETTPSA